MEFKKILSSALAFAIAGHCAVMGCQAAEYNDNISSAESKEEINEEPFDVFDIYNAYINSSPRETAPPNGQTTTAAPTTTTTVTTTVATTAKPVAPVNVKRFGIDVSRWQQSINWKKVKDSGVEFVIIQAGYGNLYSQKDPRFDEYVRGAQAVGLDVGAYWYSYADSPEDAAREAEVCWEVCKNHNLTYPIYLDIEEEKHKYMSVAYASEIVDSFCSTIESKGGYVGIYSFASFLESNIYHSVRDKYDVWVAQYGSSFPTWYSGNYGMWQYASDGIIDGIYLYDGGPLMDVDLNYSYKNYPYLISPDTYAGVTVTAAPAPAPVTTTTTAAAPSRGVDVSAVQGDIDWKQVKNSGIDFALICAGEGGKTPKSDSKFAYNIKSAHEAGLKCGAYWHSRAVNNEQILAEAETFYNTIKGNKFEYPLYLEIADANIVKAGLTSEQVNSMIGTFCSYLEEKGFYVGIYSYEYYLNNSLDPKIYEDYDVWIANKGAEKPDFKYKYGIWQYGSSTAVPGISVVTDINYSYKDYLSVMKFNHLNGY